ncbi:class F sortase [Planomonospora sp. ID67723]|uniref:class F sortase n=1 Tax=Planomonospora sp. ID67723 TaxID=2738134 RepID=UPI0018C43B0D|nr:class F sortase [Planomonospora sp. ID67723]MBG0827690.1 class F sortase [Planomonospora sp. ID67723]
MTTPTPDGRRPGPPAPGGAPAGPAQPYRQPPVRPRQGRPQAVPGLPGYPGPAYLPAHPQPGYPLPGHPGPPDPGYDDPAGGGRVLRSVLILAAIAGVVTVLVGVFYLLASPEQYGLADDRVALPPRAQNPAGAGEPYFSAPPTVPPPQPTVPAAPAMLPSTPKRLVIPRLGVSAPIRSVGLDAKGAIQVPPVNNANLVGWFREGPTAGEAGPAIMLGHKDTRSGGAVFSRLGEIRNGDVIEVHRQDGVIAVFTVGGLEQAEKSVFPTQRVYGESPDPQLHLITCGGVYDRLTGHYTDNVIVYATMTGTRRA